MAIIETLFSMSSRFEVEYFEEVLLDAESQRQKTELTLNQGSFRKNGSYVNPTSKGRTYSKDCSGKSLEWQRNGIKLERNLLCD